mmetsp:Transcript_112557/g.318850  ORF Transcript_112557/g.318850 Transcript_112557/m.318850 type:complete len:202 (+) Transcript_112557:780-1385(+)
MATQQIHIPIHSRRRKTIKMPQQSPHALAQPGSAPDCRVSFNPSRTSASMFSRVTWRKASRRDWPLWTNSSTRSSGPATRATWLPPPTVLSATVVPPPRLVRCRNAEGAADAPMEPLVEFVTNPKELVTICPNCGSSGEWLLLGCDSESAAAAMFDGIVPPVAPEMRSQLRFCQSNTSTGEQKWLNHFSRILHTTPARCHQ